MNKENSSSKEHWENIYLSKPDEKLGWYETDLTPALKLVRGTGLSRSSRILLAGAGTTTLIERLLEEGYSDLVATDISEAALDKLKQKHGSRIKQYIADDLTGPVRLLNLDPVDLWIDRAVLHFFTDTKDQDTYFNLLKSKVKQGGFVILAEFSLNGADHCSGLPVFRYSTEMLAEKLGSGYELLESFDYTYINPAGGERPYVYAMFRRP